MKLLVILSVIAYGYADKLDRTYLPPASAATAGGSPGALSAPVQPGSTFLQTPLGPQQGNFGFPQAGSGFTQGPSGIQSGANSFVSSNNGGFNGNGLGFSNNGAAPSSSYGPASQSGSAAPTEFPSSEINSQNGNIAQTSGSFNQGFIQGGPGQNVAQAYTPDRPQAAADRNAEILKYINENNIESYNYSYETANGISAEETGEAANGVRAQGGYAYTGDDGKSYSITYTADENGYQPQGEHLPTPHPIPEEILKSIEENARAAAAGTQEGAYRPEEYESEAPKQQYSSEISGFNRPVSQSFGSVQSFQTNQGQAINRPQDHQYSSSQSESSQGFLSGQSNPSNQGVSSSAFIGNTPTGQANQASSGLFNGNTQSGSAYQGSLGLSNGNAPLGSSNQGSAGSYNGNVQSRPANQASLESFNGNRQSGPSYQGSSGLFNGNTLLGSPKQDSSESFNGNSPKEPANQGSSGSFNGNAQSGLNFDQSNQRQSQGADGYKYNRPQNYFGSARPIQVTKNDQEQTSFLGSSSSVSTPNRYQSSSAPSSGSNVQLGSQSLGQGIAFNQGQNGQVSYQFSQGSPSKGQQFGPSGSTGQGTNYQSNTSPNGFGKSQDDGNQAGSLMGQGNRNEYGNRQPFGSNTESGNIASQSAPISGQNNQNQYNNKQPFGSNTGSGSIASPSTSFTGQNKQDQFGNRQPFGSNVGLGVNNAGQGASFTSQVNQNNQGNRQPFGSNIGSGTGQGVKSQSGQTSFGNRPLFGTNGQEPSQVASSSNGSKGSQTLQAPYQYTRPGQTFGNQQQQNFGSVGSNGQNGNQGTEQFGGPRQPPSYSPEEGYKY